VKIFGRRKEEAPARQGVGETDRGKRVRQVEGGQKQRRTGSLKKEGVAVSREKGRRGGGGAG
jgi:hypothetical protein